MGTTNCQQFLEKNLLLTAGKLSLLLKLYLQIQLPSCRHNVFLSLFSCFWCPFRLEYEMIAVKIFGRYKSNVGVKDKCPDQLKVVLLLLSSHKSWLEIFSGERESQMRTCFLIVQFYFFIFHLKKAHFNFQVI